MAKTRKTPAKAGKNRKYSDAQHYLTRALVLLHMEFGPQAFPIPVIQKLVGPLADGSTVPEGTLKLVAKTADQCLAGEMPLEKYFLRTSETGRKEAK